MAKLQLLPTSVADSPPNARIATFERLGSINARAAGWDRQLSALTAVLVDTLLAGDTASLQAASDPIRDRLAQLYGDEAEQGQGRELRGWLMALLAMTRLGLERLPAPEDLQYQQGTQPFQFLVSLTEERAMASSQIKEALSTGDSQVSRTGRDLIAAGLVLQRRAGRQALWELTPRGRQLVRRLEAEPTPATSRKQTSGPRPSASKTPANARRRRAAARPVAIRAYRGGAAPREVRHVVPRGREWVVAKTSDGRPIARLETKQAALTRARTILGNLGGGKLVEHTLKGSQRDIAVAPAKR